MNDSRGFEKILTVLLLFVFGTIILTFLMLLIILKKSLFFFNILNYSSYWLLILYKIGKFLLNNEVIRDGENREREGNIVTNWFSCKI